MKRINIVTAIVFFGLGLFIIAYSFTFKSTLIKDNYTGPEFFPRFVAMGMIILSLLLIVTSLRLDKNQQRVRFFTKAMKVPLFTMLMLIVYAVFLLKLLGFAASSTLLFWALLAFMKVKKMAFYVAAPLFVIGVTTLFRFVFLVQLPTGVVGF